MISLRAVRVDDEIGKRKQLTRQFVEAAAEIEFRIAESAAGVEQTREAVIIEIKSAIRQSDQWTRRAIPFPAQRAKANNPFDWQVRNADLV